MGQPAEIQITKKVDENFARLTIVKEGTRWQSRPFFSKEEGRREAARLCERVRLDGDETVRAREVVELVSLPESLTRREGTVEGALFRDVQGK